MVSLTCELWTQFSHLNGFILKSRWQEWQELVLYLKVSDRMYVKPKCRRICTGTNMQIFIIHTRRNTFYTFFAKIPEQISERSRKLEKNLIKLSKHLENAFEFADETSHRCSTRICFAMTGCTERHHESCMVSSRHTFVPSWFPMHSIFKAMKISRWGELYIPILVFAWQHFMLHL